MHKVKQIKVKSDTWVAVGAKGMWSTMKEMRKDEFMLTLEGLDEIIEKSHQQSISKCKFDRQQLVFRVVGFC
jgi:hypothetical protein